jgi:hypothetical protein
MTGRTPRIVGDMGGDTELPADDAAFVRGLVEARPIEDLTEELGWTEEKTRRKLRSSVILAAIATRGLQNVYAIHIPHAIRVIAALADGVVPQPIFDQMDKKRSSQGGVVVGSVPPAVRLAAAQTILKIARFEEHAPPTDAAHQLEEATPDQLRAVMSAIEARLADQAQPIAQGSVHETVEEAEIVGEEASIINVLD